MFIWVCRRSEVRVTWGEVEAGLASRVVEVEAAVEVSPGTGTISALFKDSPESK